MKKGYFKRHLDEIIAVATAIIFVLIMVFFTSCMSFDKAKRKFGNKAIEIEKIPYQKAIAPDSSILEINIADLIPLVPVSVKGIRSGITLNVDESGNLSAISNCDPIYIHDSIPYPVEKLIFKEADMGKYILRSTANAEKKQAVELAVLQGKMQQIKKENNLSFFEKLKNTLMDIGLGLGLLIFVILILLYFGKKLLSKFVPMMMLFALGSCATVDISKPFVVEGIYYENGEVIYDLSQTSRNGKKQYASIEEEAGAKNLFDTVFIENRFGWMFSEADSAFNLPSESQGRKGKKIHN